ncbi:MAG: helix-turn-helix transcriptional regulator, partial [Verrucomicrobiae bacterium]|nr:helix-turn-helix transcriptional regulator [Verrucomicrobiae bacterium]
GVSPQTFLIKTRVQAACEALRNTGTPIGDIALDLGFYDQSSFTGHFRHHMGVTPLRYRRESQGIGN